MKHINDSYFNCQGFNDFSGTDDPAEVTCPKCRACLNDPKNIQARAQLVAWWVQGKDNATGNLWL